MHIEAVKVRRLYLQVADQLSDLVADGSLAEGERLPSERDLASQFGVSRPTVREAMIALEIAGLVEIRSGSGVYVVNRSSQAVSTDSEDAPGPLEILEARRLIEGETAALAAGNADPDTLRALGEQLAVIDDRGATPELREQADRAFHELIAAASGNSALHSCVHWLWDLREQSGLSQRFHDSLRLAGAAPVGEDHRAVADAIAAGDPVAARKAMQDHLQRVLDQILDN
jgi:GntR family transcriptional repressor for pyruvate dehydrogenase complex